SNVVTPRHIGNAGARRKRLVQDLKPRLSAPPPPPLRPGKNRDLSHRLLLAALSRATLRALARDLDKAASAGGILTSRSASRCRTATSRASTAACATSCSTRRCSSAWITPAPRSP